MVYRALDACVSLAPPAALLLLTSESSPSASTVFAKRVSRHSSSVVLDKTADEAESLTGLDVGLVNKSTINIVDEEALREYGSQKFVRRGSSLSIARA